MTTRTLTNELGRDVTLTVRYDAGGLHPPEGFIHVYGASATSDIEHIWTVAEARVLQALISEVLARLDDEPDPDDIRCEVAP